MYKVLFFYSTLYIHFVVVIFLTNVKNFYIEYDAWTITSRSIYIDFFQPNVLVFSGTVRQFHKGYETECGFFFKLLKMTHYAMTVTLEWHWLKVFFHIIRLVTFLTFFFVKVKIVSVGIKITRVREFISLLFHQNIVQC